ELGAHPRHVGHVAPGAPLHELGDELVELRGADHVGWDGPGQHGLLVCDFRGAVAGGEPVGADDGHHDDPPHPSLLAGLLEVAGRGGEEFHGARCSGDGPVAASMTASTPARAAARPSPVMTSTPSERDIGTTSYPRSVSTPAAWRPTLPVAPATAILRGDGIAGVLPCDLRVPSTRWVASSRAGVTSAAFRRSMHRHNTTKECDRWMRTSGWPHGLRSTGAS